LFLKSLKGVFNSPGDSPSASKVKSRSTEDTRVESSSSSESSMNHKALTLPDLTTISTSKLKKSEDTEIPNSNDEVICRICEEAIASESLAEHSYVCAIAQDCEFKLYTNDVQLRKLANTMAKKKIQLLVK
jgi:hypothetical protein